MEKQIAVLIDGDNISAKYAEYIKQEAMEYGNVRIFRLYGSVNSQTVKAWYKVMPLQGIMPVLQISYAYGKSIADQALTIDAMDLLYTGGVDVFCIVSSDSDFTRLAIRLRESGMHVIGMGEQKTPKPFSTACNAFKYLEILADEELQNTGESEKVELKALESAIVRIITENANLRDEINIGELGSRLLNRYPDFDVRNYGYSKFSQFLKDFDGLSFRQEGSSILVSQKTSMTDLERIESTLVAIVRTNGTKGYNLGELKKQLCVKIPGFDVKSYGYSKFSKFVENLPSFKIKNNTVMISEN